VNDGRDKPEFQWQRLRGYNIYSHIFHCSHPTEYSRDISLVMHMSSVWWHKVGRIFPLIGYSVTTQAGHT